MDRFLTTLCLNGVRTSDNIPLHVVDAQTLSLDGKLVTADDVVERALPSRVATAIETSMAAAPAFSTSVFFLLGAQVHRGRLGDAVVHYVVRDQAQHRSMLYERQVAQRPTVTVVSSDGRDRKAAQPLQYEECLLFAYDDGAVACETLRAGDAASTVDEVLESLRVISLAVFKYAGNKTCVLLVGSHLSTAHMAALLLASRRHVFLYVDANLSAQEVAATAHEMQQVRQSLCTFAQPLSDDVRHARASVAEDRHADSLRPSRTLDALAHSKEEYELLVLAVAQEERTQERSGGGGRGASRSVHDEHAKWQREVGEARAAQEAAEAELAKLRQMHREEILSLREELKQLAEERKKERDVEAERGLLHSFQQQQSHSHAPPSLADESVVAQLQEALQGAVKAQKFAEEKVRLLELRQSMMTAQPGASSALDPSVLAGSVVSPRPSLRLPPNPGDPAAAAWEQSLLQQENTALVAEFQRKEKEWQQRLRHASADVAQLRQEKTAMEATLRLQSQTIAAAQQALVETRAVQEQEMAQLLGRVRTLSQESRSRHRSSSSTPSAEATATAAAAAGQKENGGSGVLSATSAVHVGTHAPSPLSSSSASAQGGARNSALLSPTRQ